MTCDVMVVMLHRLFYCSVSDKPGIARLESILEFRFSVTSGNQIHSF